MRGKVFPFLEIAIVQQDHPRLCGEKSANSFFSALYLGSPPPMRGKGTAADFSLAPTRITPAYAGKSLRQYAIGSMEKDHPRLCGEKGFTSDLPNK